MIQIIERWTCARCGWVEDQERGLPPLEGWSAADYFPDLLKLSNGYEEDHTTHTPRPDGTTASKHFCPDCSEAVVKVLNGEGL